MTKRAYKLKKVAETPESRERHRKALAAVELEKERIIARGRVLCAADAWRRIFADLRSARQQQGMTLDELAEATGIAKSALSIIENEGNTNPKIGTIRCIATALGKAIELNLVDAKISR